MTIKLFTWPRSSGTKIHWALEELGIPYERVVLDRAKGENRTANYLALSPGGKVPAIDDEGVHVFESSAILAYLGETYGVEKGLWPRAVDERATALSWTVWSVTELQGFMMQYAYHGLDSPVSYRPEQRSAAAADYNHAQLGSLLDGLERQLAGRDFALGTFSLVDVALASVLGFGQALGVDLGSRPRTRSWLARCQARPALARAM